MASPMRPKLKSEWLKISVKPKQNHFRAMKTTSNQQTDQKYNLTQNQIEELVKSPKDQPVVSFPIPNQIKPQN
jgi:hypothetical protein